MATSNDEIYVKIITDVQSSLQGLANLALGYLSVTKAIQEIKKVLVESFQAYKDAEDSEAHLNAALKITGQYSVGASTGLMGFAKSLQMTTTFSHETTESAMGLLMQLGNLTEQGVKQAIPVLQDWASAVGIDMNTAAEQFVRMLSGTTDSMGRFHLQVEKGLDPGQRFAALLDSMKDKAGGLAETMGKTLGGQLTILNNQINDLKETLGGLIAKMVLPTLQNWVRGLNVNEIMKVDPKTINDIATLQTYFNIMAKQMEEFAGYKDSLYSRERQYWKEYNDQTRAIWDQIQALTKSADATTVNAHAVAAAAAAYQELKFNYPSFMGDPGGLRVGMAGPTTMPQGGIFNPNQTSNGSQLTNDFKANDQYFKTFLDLAKQTHLGLSQIPIDMNAIKIVAAENAAIMQQIADAAVAFGTSMAKGDIQGAFTNLGMMVAKQLVASALLAAATAAGLAQWGTMAFWLGVAGVGVIAEVGLGSQSGSQSSVASLPAGGTPLGNTVNVTVQGSVISERGLARSIAAQMSNW